MRWKVSMLPINNYEPKELIQEPIPEKYYKNDAGDFILAGTFFDTESTIFQLIHFLFQTKEDPPEVYRDNENYILDLSPFKNRLIQIKDLALLYPEWLQLTERENTMDEYGTLIDFIGFGHTQNRNHLVMVVSRYSHQRNY